MKDVIEANAKGVAVYIGGSISAYILFSTDSVEYSSHSAGLHGLSESEPCIIISKNKIVMANSFRVHVWNAKEKTHKYTFSFNNVDELDTEIRTGDLEYEYSDEAPCADKANWKSKTVERESLIECIPLSACTNNMWKQTDRGELNLQFKFLSGENET